MFSLCLILGFLCGLLNPVVSNGSHICSPESPSQREFKCVQESECINKDNVCDGAKDCSDGSDEDSCFTRKPRSTSACILPPYPDHGTYEVSNVPKTAGPGQSFNSILMKVICERGYGIIGSGYTADANSTQDLFCINGDWSRKMPECVRFCRLDQDPSVRYMCTQFQECNKYVSPGTLVVPICNSPVYYSTDSLQYMKCAFGSWNYIAQCKPDCGRITPSGVQLVIDGKPAKRGEFPWHVGIYRKTKPFLQICGGSLVSNNVVMSAAHCFWSDVRKLLPASNFAVAIGKLYRAWDDERDIDAQTSDVKHIAIPTLFRGIAAHFQDDIAVLTLTTPFIYKTYVRPVCLNFDISFDTWHLQLGNLGKVAGWGLTGAQGVASETLQVVDMPFINEATCINTLPASFTAFITSDKFCAGYTKGTALCRGDSGGGIVFADREQGIDRYYLRGIVSTAPTTEDKLCNDETYITFTKITKHEAFIKYALVDASAVESCPVYKFQCTDGTCMNYEAECAKKRVPVTKPSTTSNRITTTIAPVQTQKFDVFPITPPTTATTNSKATERPTTAISNGSSKLCILPPYPNNGTYVVKPYLYPYNDSFILNVSCNPGFVLDTSFMIRDETATVKCSSGQWDHAVPKCIVPEPVKPSCQHRSPCRDNTICSEKDDVITCTCLQGFAGNPYNGCYPTCRNDKDCSAHSKCIEKRCMGQRV